MASFDSISSIISAISVVTIPQTGLIEKEEDGKKSKIKRMSFTEFVAFYKS